MSSESTSNERRPACAFLRPAAPGAPPGPDDLNAYSYHSPDDLAFLAADIYFAHDLARRRIVVQSIRRGLVKADISLPFLIFLTLLTLVFGKEVSAACFRFSLFLRPELTLKAWTKTLRWMVEGRHSHDDQAAGGWNQTELLEFLKICRAAGWQPPRLPERCA